MAPLYDPETQSLKPLCVRALKRIFLMCDKDKDGLLNDKELNEFQVKCFNAPLQPEELAGVKDVVRSRLENGLVDDQLTFTGFVFLHALFIERGRLETTWAVRPDFTSRFHASFFSPGSDSAPASGQREFSASARAQCATIAAFGGLLGDWCWVMAVGVTTRTSEPLPSGGRLPGELRSSHSLNHHPGIASIVFHHASTISPPVFNTLTTRY